MNDEERFAYVRRIREAKIAIRMSPEGLTSDPDLGALAVLKEFEDKVREDAEQELRYHIDEGGEI